MISYRPFRNTDTPQLVAVWRAQPQQRGLARPMSVDLFEQCVLAKPYFENEGLIVALDDSQIVGFVHAGFGPTADEQGLSRQLGVTSLLLLRPDYQRADIASELLARSEQYLRSRGAQVLYAGGVRPLNPFYLGLYGGSELPGVLLSDAFSNAVYRSADYREIDRVTILDRELATFRLPFNRDQMAIRRNYVFKEAYEPPPGTWWEACTLSRLQVIEYAVAERNAAAPVALARFWSMDTFAGGWGMQAAGLCSLEVDIAHRRRGLALYLLSESFRRLSAERIALVEVQTMAGNTAAQSLYAKLGFQTVDSGIVYRKQS